MIGMQGSFVTFRDLSVESKGRLMVPGIAYEALTRVKTIAIGEHFIRRCIGRKIRSRVFFLFFLYS